jgi:hypothetical protein
MGIEKSHSILPWMVIDDVYSAVLLISFRRLFDYALRWAISKFLYKNKTLYKQKCPAENKILQGTLFNR